MGVPSQKHHAPCAPFGAVAGQPRPQVLAHRGASAHAPENSLAAFDLALECGADGLEIDLRRTADRRLVALHDQTLLRTTGADLPIADLALKAVPPQARPPRLRRLLRRYAERTHLLLEAKEPSRAMLRQLMRAIHGPGLDLADITIQTFDMRALRWLARGFPEVQTAALVEQVPDSRTAWIDDLAYLGVAAICVSATALDGDLVALAHERHLRVGAWTVNDARQAVALASAGVDALVTDDPSLIRAALACRST